MISFEDISVQNVTCFRCNRAPDVTPYPARGKDVDLRKNKHIPGEEPEILLINL
jgi:hypothetical protein